METLTQDRFNSLSLIVFFTHALVFSKQGHATKVFIQMASPLTFPFLGFRHFRKLIQPLLIGHERRLTHGYPTRGATGPIEHWPGRGSVDLFPTGVQTVFFSGGERAHAHRVHSHGVFL